jgi:hypothetical protein
MLNRLAKSFKKLVSKEHSVVLPQPQGITTNEKLCKITRRRLMRTEAGKVLLHSFDTNATYERYCRDMIYSGAHMHETVCRYEFGYIYNLLNIGK